MDGASSSPFEALRPEDVDRGNLDDRPWGITLATLGLTGRTGQVTLLVPDDKVFHIAFFRGALVGAQSPVPADAAVRVALTSRYITSAQVPELARRVAVSTRDEIDALATAAALSPEQTRALRKRVIAQRAARSFSVERAQLIFDDHITIPVSFEVDVDVRAVIYAGARMQLAPERLAEDLRLLGTRFVLRPDAKLAPFELTEEEQPIIDALHVGTSLPEIEAIHRDIDPRAAQAVLYALACCDAVVREELDDRYEIAADATVEEAPAFRDPTISRLLALHPPTMTRTPTPRDPVVSRVPTLREPETSEPLRSRRRDQMTTQAASVSALQARRHEAITDGLPVVDFAESSTTIERPNPLPSDQLARAHDHYILGEKALASGDLPRALVELRRATELDPANVDYLALLAWVTFCSSPDRAAVAPATRRALEKAVYRSAQPDIARYYLGRVERLLGRDQAALRHFREVLARQPDHEEAAAEIRTLESRFEQTFKPRRTSDF